MKNLFIVSILVIASYMSSAQATSIRIRNHTACTIYFSLGITTNANPCGSPGSSTNIVSLAAGGVVVYTSTTWPGYTSGSPFTHLLMGKFYDTNPASLCNFPAAIVGEPCSGFPPALPTRWFNTNCSLCAIGSVSWVSPGTPMGMINVSLF